MSHLIFWLTFLTANGNIIITNDANTQSWWVAFYISNQDLSCGGTITNIQITDNNNYLNTWVAYDSNQWGYYSFVNNGNAYTAPISVKITKTNNAISETIIAHNLISLTAGETFDFGSNFCQTGLGSPNLSNSPTIRPSKTPTTPTTTTSISPTNFNMPYFVSYVGQIGPGWGYSYNTVLLSNLGVPGYSNHPYNVLNFAFWISSSNAATATATDCWQHLATYISDTTLRQTLTGKTNPSSAELRQAIKDIYIANGIKILVSAFGANDDPQSAGRNPTQVGTNLANYAIQYLYDGVDIDWEEGSYFNNAGDGEIWLETLTNTLDNILNPFNKNYLITHAPQAPYFMGSTLNQYRQGGYLTVHNSVGNKIDWYNVQFYNQGSTTYNSYSNMFQTSVGWSRNSAVYQMINGNNPQQISIPANKIVVGKHSLGDGSDFIDGNTLKNIFNQALAANSPVWNTGFMCWQFYTENNQNPKFQVVNEVVSANWDPNPSKSPTGQPTKYASNNPTTLPTQNSTIQTTQTDNCLQTQNFTQLFSSARSRGKRLSITYDESISYGIDINITLNYTLNNKYVSNIINIVSEIMKTLIDILIPKNCFHSFSIKSIHSYMSININFEIFVCNQQQQLQLRNPLNTNKYQILCKVINTIENRTGLLIPINSATFKTDTIEIFVNNINTTHSSDYNDNSDGFNIDSNFKIVIIIVLIIVIICLIFIIYDKCIKNKNKINSKNSVSKKRKMEIESCSGGEINLATIVCASFEKIVVNKTDNFEIKCENWKRNVHVV